MITDQNYTLTFKEIALLVNLYNQSGEQKSGAIDSVLGTFQSLIDKGLVELVPEHDVMQARVRYDRIRDQAIDALKGDRLTDAVAFLGVVTDAFSQLTTEYVYRLTRDGWSLMHSQMEPAVAANATAF